MERDGKKREGRVGRGERETHEKSTHGIMETEKSRDLLTASWRPRIFSGVI